MKKIIMLTVMFFLPFLINISIISAKACPELSSSDNKINLKYEITEKNGKNTATIKEVTYNGKNIKVDSLGLNEKSKIFGDIVRVYESTEEVHNFGKGKDNFGSRSSCYKYLAYMEKPSTYEGYPSSYYIILFDDETVNVAKKWVYNPDCVGTKPGEIVCKDIVMPDVSISESEDLSKYPNHFYSVCDGGFSVIYKDGKIEFDNQTSNKCVLNFTALSYKDFIKDGKLTCPDLYYSTNETNGKQNYYFYPDFKSNYKSFPCGGITNDDDGGGSGELEPGDIVTGCEVIPEVVRKWINNILKFVRYVALALVIALGALDFMKAAGDGEADAMKKAGQSFMKRMIAVVILFLLPVIVDFILNMVNIYGVDPNNIDCLK